MTAAPTADVVPDALARSLRAGLVELLAQVADAKRLRVAGRAGTLAEQAFVRSWSLLVAGTSIDDVAAAEVAGALAAVRLAGVDVEALTGGGASTGDAVAVLRSAADDVAAPLADLGSDRWWREGLAARTPWGDLAVAPAFVGVLAVQPRAGATAPGQRRIIVEPPESHGDHCATVAVYAALLAPAFGADPARAFTLGLAHHLHNAGLPDAGFAGDVLLGDLRHPVEETYQERALTQLPGSLVGELHPLLALRSGTDDPLSQTFHAADALDRVLQVHHHARAAAFTAPQALEDLDLVHVGPEQRLQLAVLRAAGLS